MLKKREEIDRKEADRKARVRSALSDGQAPIGDAQ